MCIVHIRSYLKIAQLHHSNKHSSTSSTIWYHFYRSVIDYTRHRACKRIFCKQKKEWRSWGPTIKIIGNMGSSPTKSCIVLSLTNVGQIVLALATLNTPPHVWRIFKSIHGQQIGLCVSMCGHWALTRHLGQPDSNTIKDLKFRYKINWKYEE